MTSGAAASRPFCDAHRGDDDEDAVLGEVTAVAQGDVLDVPDAQPVDERAPHVELVGEPGDAAPELDDGAVLGEHDPVRGHAGVAREPRLRGEHAELAVDGHDVVRPEQREDRADLLGVPVAGDVHRGDLLVQHLRARTWRAG